MTSFTSIHKLIEGPSGLTNTKAIWGSSVLHTDTSTWASGDRTTHDPEPQSPQYDQAWLRRNKTNGKENKGMEMKLCEREKLRSVAASTLSISHRTTDSTSGLFTTSLSTPPSPPPIISTWIKTQISVQWHLNSSYYGTFVVRLLRKCYFLYSCCS